MALVSLRYFASYSLHNYTVDQIQAKYQDLKGQYVITEMTLRSEIMVQIVEKEAFKCHGCEIECETAHPGDCSVCLDCYILSQPEEDDY